MDRDALNALCRRIDGRPYPAYRDLVGSWRLGEVEVLVDHVQGDPFAAPSRLRLRVAHRLERGLWDDEDGRLACEDALLRAFGRACGGRRRGSGRSGELGVYRPGPEVCERSALRLLDDGRAEVRFTAGLPARGRRVLGRQAFELLTLDVVEAAEALVGAGGVAEQVASVRLQRRMRRALGSAGLVAFVADGAVLPRASGIDQAPLRDAVPFRSPPSLRTELCGVTGMGVPRGVTLIVGGGFHGKSTLLAAVQRGHLDHVPGDGRERVVALADTVKVRAEDGRRVAGVDISSLLADLPGGRSTAPFSTDDASGSTSQAAAVVEAVESGARVLLLDEDTSATNLLVRDPRMRALVPREREPITPLVERVRQVVEVWGLSVVMVVGGVGDFLAVADTVVGMDAYVPADLTERAAELAGPVPEPPGPLEVPAARRVDGGLSPGRKVRARDERRLRYGEGEIELSAVEQVLDAAHARTVGHALRVLHEVSSGGETVPALLDALEHILADEGLEALSPFREPDGALIRPRRHEVAAALNRLRSLRVG